MLGRVRPGLVGDASGGIGDASALLGQLEGGALGLGEDSRLAPCRDQVQPQRGFPGLLGVLGVHVDADGAAVDLAGPDLHQRLRCGRQRRVLQDPARRVDVLDELLRNGGVGVVQTSIHD